MDAITNPRLAGVSRPFGPLAIPPEIRPPGTDVAAVLPAATTMKLRIAVLLLALGITARADLFLSSFSGNTVYRFTDTGTQIGAGPFVTLAGNGGLNLPHKPLLFPDGNLYVASAANDRILRYDGTTGAFLNAFIQPNANGLGATDLDYPVDMAFGPDGNLYVSSQLNDAILRFNPNTGAFLGSFASGGILDGPSGITFANGSLYAVGRFRNNVVRYDFATGAVNGSFSLSGLNQPFGIDVGADGRLYVAEGNAGRVLRIDQNSGSVLSTFASGLSLPIGVGFGPGGDLFVANFNADTVSRFDGVTGASEGTFVPASAGADGANFFSFSVPEPGSALLLAAGSALLAQRSRRRANVSNAGL
jgi:outer membrane protein assembly factor BamB